IRAAFEVLEICKKIKSESEMKKMLKDDVKELKELEKEVPSLTRAKRIWDSQKSIGKISTEQYDGALSNLETKKKRLEELQEKQKSL
ncbi:MAG: hypothetical protein KKE71_06625, partial [Nanoarchaeota archaeon]|nr:hypothetical protein [Nanoarchaeota archaeon]